MKILVTGSHGFIGRAVVNELTLRGHEHVKFDLPRDVREPFHLRGLAQDCDGIINLAGKLGTPELFGHELEAASVNILGAITVYDVAKQLDIPVVQIGTGHKGQPNPYAITKACAEDIGFARAQWTGEKINIVRAYHVYGEHQAVGPPHGKASVHKFFPTFACRALTDMPLELCGGGKQLIDPIHVSDCASILVDGLYGRYGELREAGNGVGVSVEQVAFDIAREVAGHHYVDDAPQRDGEPLRAVVVAEKPLAANPWPYMVPETVEWYKQWLLSSQ